jgi:hypothetical protein
MEDIIINGYKVNIGDKWQLKNEEIVTIIRLTSGTWPIVAETCDGSTMSFTINGIYSSDKLLSEDDLFKPLNVIINEAIDQVDSINDTIEEPTKNLDDSVDILRYAICEPIVKQKFLKFDAGKPRFNLIDPDWHTDVAKVLTMGAQKYEANNWKLNEELDRYIDALERHLIEIKKGKFKDSESKLQHTAHIACNTMFLHYMIRNGIKL